MESVADRMQNLIKHINRKKESVRTPCDGPCRGHSNASILKAISSSQSIPKNLPEVIAAFLVCEACKGTGNKTTTDHNQILDLGELKKGERIKAVYKRTGKRYPATYQGQCPRRADYYLVCWEDTPGKTLGVHKSSLPLRFEETNEDVTTEDLRRLNRACLSYFAYKAALRYKKITRNRELRVDADALPHENVEHIMGHSCGVISKIAADYIRGKTLVIPKTKPCDFKLACKFGQKYKDIGYHRLDKREPGTDGYCPSCQCTGVIDMGNTRYKVDDAWYVQLGIYEGGFGGQHYVAQVRTENFEQILLDVQGVSYQSRTDTTVNSKDLEWCSRNELGHSPGTRIFCVRSAYVQGRLFLSEDDDGREDKVTSVMNAKIPLTIKSTHYKNTPYEAEHSDMLQYITMFMRDAANDYDAVKFRRRDPETMLHLKCFIKNFLYLKRLR